MSNIIGCSILANIFFVSNDAYKIYYTHYALLPNRFDLLQIGDFEARVNRNSFVLIVFKTILLSNEDSLVQVEYSDRLGRVNNFKMQSLKMSLLLLAFMVTKCN